MEEKESIKVNRNLLALIGVVVMLFAGFVYAWSIIAAPIAADFPDWSSAQLSLTFTLCMIFFCLGGIGAGVLSKKIGVRFIMLMSAVLFIVGFSMASRTNSLTMLYIGYGVLCGTASGFSYNSIMNVIPRHFPERQGLISGILLMGFGASSLVIGTIFTAVTPEVTGAWRGSLLTMGIIMAVVIAVAAFFFPKEVLNTTAKAVSTSSVDELSDTPGQMLRRSNFWFYFIWVVALNAVGLIIIGQAKALAGVAAPDFSAGTLSLVVGLISVSNGFGRVIYGALYDRKGYRLSLLMVSLCALVAVAILFIATEMQVSVLIVLAFIFVGLAYGGTPTMSAAITKSFFGSKHFAINFPVMNLSLLVASFSSTAAGGLYDMSGNYRSTFMLIAALVALSLAIQVAIKKPEIK